MGLFNQPVWSSDQSPLALRGVFSFLHERPPSFLSSACQHVSSGPPVASALLAAGFAAMMTSVALKQKCRLRQMSFDRINFCKIIVQITCFNENASSNDTIVN